MTITTTRRTFIKAAASGLAASLLKIPPIQASRTVTVIQNAAARSEENARRCGTEESFRALHASRPDEQTSRDDRPCPCVWPGVHDCNCAVGRRSVPV